MIRTVVTRNVVLAVAAAMVCCNAAVAAATSAEVDRAVGRGLEWLANHQSHVGHWTASGEQYPTAMTALAGIALLCEGSTTMQGKYAPNIRKAVDYLVSRSRSNGLIGDPTRDSRYTYGHGFAMLFLSQVLGEEEDADRREELIEVLTKAVEFTGPGADARRRLGLRQFEGRRRFRRRLDHDHPGASAARLPERRHSRAQGNHRQGGRRTSRNAPTRTAACAINWRAAAAAVVRRSPPRPSLACSTPATTTASMSPRCCATAREPGRRLGPGRVGPLALCPLLLLAGLVSRRRQDLGSVSRQDVSAARVGGRQRRLVEPRATSARCSPRPSI